MTLFEEGKLDEAREAVEAAILLMPDYYLVYYQLGNILERIGDTEKALEAVKRSIELRPDFAQAILKAGLLYEVLDLRDEALKMYRLVLEKGREGDREGEIARLRLRGLRQWQGSFGISQHYNTNITLGRIAQGSPSTGYSLNLRFLPVQSNRYRLTASMGSSRSIQYLSQFVSDGLSFSLVGGISPSESASVAGSYSFASTFVEGEKRSENTNASLSLSLIPPEGTPSSLSLSMGMGRPRSETSSASEMNQYNIGVSAVQRVGARNSMTMGYSFAIQTNLYPEGSNYASRTQGVSLGYSRNLGPWGQISTSIGFQDIRYINPDSTTLFRRYRRNQAGSVSLSLASKLSDRVSMTLSSGYNENRTNLPRPTAEEAQTLEEILTSPIPTVGGGYKSLSFGLSLSTSF
ncbi:MAG: tetratricopeptide repeat protein [Nitrospirae bacterium]|nr:tetratricopeptide repeat protein [Nitrospirota bacterium]